MNPNEKSQKKYNYNFFGLAGLVLAALGFVGLGFGLRLGFVGLGFGLILIGLGLEFIEFIEFFGLGLAGLVLIVIGLRVLS